ncbi:hypothetical protein NKG99_20380 [Mesorhizobium sp. M1409]|uniref:hypothetical protein n=1 Tax=Mesorhizobium sp. M1409 TaxID=2957100 RepID=UPI00333836FC
MPFDGSGTFNRVMNWVSDAAAGIKIKSDRHDSEDDNFAAGLSNTLTKDGQSQPTANIPLNGKKLVNVGAPTVGTDAATKSYADGLLANTALTGVPTAPTAAPGTNTTQLATTAFVNAAPLGTPIHAAPAKTTPVDADEVPISDSAAAWVVKKLTFTNLKAFLKTYFDTLYASLTGATFTGQITLQSSGPMLYMQDIDASAYDFWVHANSNHFYVLADRNNDGAFEGPHPLDLDAVSSAGYLFGNTIWTTANDGSGSGLNADLLDGFQSSQANAGSTVAVRDGSGDIVTRLFRSEYPAGSDAVNALIGMNATGAGADNYMRPITLGAAASRLAPSLAASGAVYDQIENRANAFALAYTANAAAGSLGSYAFVSYLAGLGIFTAGMGIAGSNLTYASAAAAGSGSPGGSWRTMGYAGGSGTSRITLAVRYA